MADHPSIIGRFEIQIELGRGAMGRVYLAHDPKIDRKVAIKTIHSNPGSSQAEASESQVRFLREAQAAGRLLHPGIVTIFDVGEDHGDSYIAMEYIDGPTLEAATKSDNLMPVEKVVQLIIQACDALHFAHQHKIIHRDVKPANLMLVENRQVKVTDFGLAKNPSADLTSAGTLIGTPTYMSPEQIMGKALDGRSDLFSLGVVLYELLTGARPFGGETISTIIYRILHEHPTRPDLANPRVPAPLCKILLRAIEKDPASRYASCKDLGTALQEYLDSVTSGSGSQRGGRAALAPPTELLAPGATGSRIEGPDLELEAEADDEPADRVRSMADVARRSVEQSRASRSALRQSEAAAVAAAGAAVAAIAMQSAVRPAPRSRAPVVALAVFFFLAASAAVAYLRPDLLDRVGLAGLASSLQNAGLLPSAPRTGEEAPAQAAPAPAGPAVDLPSPLPEGEVVTISVTTDPPGGRIYLDNSEITGDSITLAKSDKASHTLVGENECYVDRTTVKASREEPVRIELKTPRLEPVRVTSTPPGAAIFLDGRSAGARTPADINVELCQPHTVGARLEGHQNASRDFAADTDWVSSSTVALDLPPLPDGFVSIKAPYALRVLEGDAPVGRAGERLQLKAGSHSLTLVNEDLFVRISAEVVVKPDDTVTPAVEFPGVGAITVHANPSSGEIFVNGRKLGTPPILDYSLAEGTYKIRYVLPTGQSQEQTVLVIEGQRAPVKFILK